MNETSLWVSMKRGMEKYWDASRHEDCVGVGVPDVSFGLFDNNPLSSPQGPQGWIELKSHKAWPKRGATLLDTHLTSVQRRWLMSRGKTGASCWLLMRVEQDILLYYWTNLPPRKATQRELRCGAVAVWNRRVDWRQLRLKLAENNVLPLRS